MLNKACYIVFVFIVACSTLFAQDYGRLEGIGTELNSILRVTKAPGFAVAVVKGEKVIYAQGFGYRHWEDKMPMDANTLFPVGSTTKAFTSALLGQLRDEGKLSFADSPIKHIQELEFYTEALNGMINIKDLMTHQTGIPRHDESWYLFPTPNKDSLIRRIKYHEPFTGIRQQWHYNNFMFLIQGVLGERLTGKSWEQNIRERFFVPLDMQRSNTSLSELKKSTNVALGYELKQDTLIKKMDYFNLAGMAPAGSINSSANEMAKWLIVWLNKGRYQQKQILPQVYVEEAMSSQAVTSASLPDEDFPDMHLSTYGYGWFISSYRGHYRVQHEGNIDGFSANVSFFPSDGLGIVVLTNQNGSSITSMVRNTIADRMLHTERTDWVKDFIITQEKAKKERKGNEEIARPNIKTADNPLHALNSYTGYYGNKGYGQFKIVKEKDSLFAQFKLQKYYLKHLHHHVFAPFEATDMGIDLSKVWPIQFNFRTDDDGEIVCVGVNLEGMLKDPILFARKVN